jgi:hypothetical protein
LGRYPATASQIVLGDLGGHLLSPHPLDLDAVDALAADAEGAAILDDHPFTGSRLANALLCSAGRSRRARALSVREPGIDTSPSQGRSTKGCPSGERRAEQPAFVPVPVVPEDMSPHDGSVDVVLRGGRTLRVGPGFDAVLLQRLVAVLEEAPPC